MKKNTLLLVLTSFLVILTAGVAFSEDGYNNCGYEMVVIPVEQSPDLISLSSTPAILDAWTTNDPFGNPFSEVYDFTRNVDILAFVVAYYHVGGALPEQWTKGWKCGTDIPRKKCKFTWTIPFLPPGLYLLVNYFEPVTFNGTSDWAAKVGDVVFGWPDIDASRPWCFTVHN